MNATTISSLVVAVASLAGALTAYLKSQTTQNRLNDHLSTVAKTGTKDYEPPNG